MGYIDEHFKKVEHNQQYYFYNPDTFVYAGCSFPVDIINADNSISYYIPKHSTTAVPNFSKTELPVYDPSTNTWS